MKFLFLVAVFSLLCLSCAEEEPGSFDLQIGDWIFELPLHEDSEKTKNGILEKVMPLWHGLSEGNSEWFSYTVTIYANSEEEAGLVQSRKSEVTAGSWRFFKDRNGLSGIEVMGPEGEPIEDLAGSSLSDSEIRKFLKSGMESAFDHVDYLLVK